MTSSDLQVTYGLAALTPADVVAVCRHAGCPLPTPDVDLASCLALVGLTAESLHASLSGVTDLRLMLAAAAIRGVTRLPRDPRLDPLPHAPTPGRAAPDLDGVQGGSSPRPRPAPRPAPAARPAAPWTPEHVLTTVAPNPKKQGSASWDRYRLYVVGSPVSALLASGVRRADLVWDLERGFLVLSPPGSSEPTAGEGS